MNPIKHVRANKFDQWIGELQTKKSIDYGVGNSILDIGCGIGMFTPMFLTKFKEVVGLDPSEEYLKIARKKNKQVDYVVGYGETFKSKHKFDTINMNMLLEHVDNPVKLLKNCKRLLSPNGRIIIQVPNSESIARRLGVIMCIIPSLNDISKREKEIYGHKRVYNQDTLEMDCHKAGLKVLWKQGLLYKPLSNSLLLELCKKHGQRWTKKFIHALFILGKGHISECANLIIVCQ
jgi:2-polyprenyl-3-methyl-5-hydroxy-6-metoxy-1,4-benzoquinol methylase